MAEDIDIEEHDLLQNPTVKEIFPDLSVLKQEIMDFDKGLPEYAANSKETDNNILFNNTTGNIRKSGTSKKSSVTNNFCAKIILGSKPNKVTKNLKSDLKKDVKIILQNITPYLTRTMRFCKTCLILFPNNVSLNHHKLSFHPSLVYRSSKNITICPGNKKKYNSSLCQREFTTQCSLRRHKQNIHDQRNNGEIRNKEDKDIVKTYDLQTNNFTIFQKPCFHCNKLFLNQEELIDHLYTILYAKKAQVSLHNTAKQEIPQVETSMGKNIILPKNIIVNSDIDKKEKLSESKNLQLQSLTVYSCPICSYYFNEDFFCRNHVIVKHKAMKNVQINKSSFNPMCKFCNFKHDNILSYNTHLRKFHKIEMLKQINSVILSNDIQTRPCNSNNFPETSTVVYSNQMTILLQNPKRQDLVKHVYDHIQVIVSKIILFKCSECDVHFLTSGAAFKHFEHTRFQENWECTNCHRLFKDKDAKVHQKQHKCSNYFSIKTVFAEIQARILYKCPMCAVHFNKDFFSEHCNVCDSEQSRSTESSYCRICDIFIESSIKPSHENDHNIRNFTRTNFEIIDSESPILKKHKKNHNQKCSDDPLILETSCLPNSMVFEPKTTKISKRLPAKKRLTYNYCNTCKCNISSDYKRNFHRKLHRVNIVKYICKYCGLIFSNKSITSHIGLHYKYKTLKLQDFTFYNMQNNKLMKPLIPEFPKCELCEKHFISKVEIKGHLCDLIDYFICSICKTIFSETAYKLHMPFHNYKIGSRIKQSNELHNTIISRHDLNEINESILTRDDLMPIIYTCKNCNLSLNTYDEVIEHCHLHTNLNKVEVNAVECSTCELKFSNLSYNAHMELHNYLENVKFTRFYFDLLFFGSDKWLKHIFKSLSKHKVNTLIGDSIYKYETRMKMVVMQGGPSNLMIYKCEKCQCIIDCNDTYSHISSCCPNSEISDCTFCGLSFACNITRNNHEKIHASPDITIKSYRIVVFNREEDRNVNYNISTLKKCYVVYECRYCHVLVENYNYMCHICPRNDCKKCNVCGLLICTENLNDHILKHKLVPSFNENKIKVILLGSKIEENNILKINNDVVPTFSGIVCDYTFYKCIDCEVCVRDVRNTVQHSCLIDAAKSQCIKCDLIFDEGKLKGHLKLHDTDPDFTRETILVKPFTNRKSSKPDGKPNKLFAIEMEQNVTSVKTTGDLTQVYPKIVKLYKCSCGLHYLQQSSLQEHMKKCSGKNKSIHTCSKCCLSFTSDVLFKHLLEHHGDKTVVFKYEIVENLQ